MAFLLPWVFPLWRAHILLYILQGVAWGYVASFRACLMRLTGEVCGLDAAVILCVPIDKLLLLQ